MKLAYPNSFLTLLMIGFSLMALPLLFAFASATLYMDDINKQSRIAVTNAVEATRDCRNLIEQITHMEQAIRQYQVLGDNAQLDNYIEAHHQFDKLANLLKTLPLEQKQHEALDKVAAEVDKIGAELPLADSPKITHLLKAFSTLYIEANEILAASNRMIDRETASLENLAERAQRALMWQALSLIPFTLLITTGIAYLVARPLRQIDLAIHHLGDGKLDKKIEIHGPQDLKNLGSRLDWLRTQLKEMELQKNRFLREVSHELKTPLTAVREGTELLSEGVGGNLTAKQRQITNILRDNSQRLQKMIEDLLLYSASQFHPESIKQQVSLGELLESVLSHHALTLASRHIQLIKTFPSIHLMGDKVKLATLFDNLISNAVKFTPEKGTVKILLFEHKNHVVIEIMDSGPGVSVEDRLHLFTPFFQGDAAHFGHIKGSGLGLSIARECALYHNGNIELVDTPDWHGGHFRVTLPLTHE